MTQKMNQLRLIIPDAKQGKVLKTCVRCRQHKTKCDAITTNPFPCSHCFKKNLSCKLDMVTTKRTTHTNVVNNEVYEKLTNEVEDLKVVLDKLIERRNNMVKLLIQRGAAIQKENMTPSVSQIQSCIQTPEDIPMTPTITASPTSDAFVISTNKSVAPIALTHKQAHILFNNYESNFNKYLPIFPDEFFTSLDLVKFNQENELLFWCIVFTSYLNNPIPNCSDNYKVLAEHIKSLVVEKCWFQTPRSVYVISSLLILTTWPIPNNSGKIGDHLAIKFISTMKSLSYQFGLHKLEFIDEFSHKTKMNISKDINLNNLIRERIYKFININSNYWLISLGLSNNNYNGFTQDYIINKSSNIDIYKDTSPCDHYINSMLKISMIQAKLNENMNVLLNDTNESIMMMPNQINTTKLINFNMFEIILNDLSKMLGKHDYLDNLISVSIEYSKLQLFIYSLSQSDITILEYKKYITKIVNCSFTILTLVKDLQFNQLPAYYKLPIEFSLLILIRIFKSPILNSYSDYQFVKNLINQFYKIIFSDSKWRFINSKLAKIVSKFDKLDNLFIIDKMKDVNGNPSFFLVNKMKNYLCFSLNYELIWLIFERERSDKMDEQSKGNKVINWDTFGISDDNYDFINYIKSNESVFI
ncbi:putative transcription factor [Spathaspora passalidarum NRRL Y-27907]|uniref:Putative transcription factor n=1 Tax=Spathaspora passalidarum (strain NRRL Y-27907 / 11-Y1) TaxID=619300 RepID=G3ANU2_SPAPN|nr:putative transcription factor [Spathaspora passalidarum NRRL Y-27907]EGW32027.1 putative transcription factor [Spathaspora passalidarum NRRL Y-27907]